MSLYSLAAEHDRAGAAIELYRRDWQIDPVPVQWNLVSSQADSLRGVHVHLTHWDYLHVAIGEMLLGLRDMRPWSSTYGLAVQRRLRGDVPSSIAIPPGVAHGFYFAAPTGYFYAVSHYWSHADDLGCRWNDPELNLAWPTTNPLLSLRDRDAPSYRELVRELAEAVSRGALHP
ncbi:MAG: dTDP-4-dehydrorhamnose 3,5-epimerase family protein [Dongiaceae bacterium]